MDDLGACLCWLFWGFQFFVVFVEFKGLSHF